MNETATQSVVAITETHDANATATQSVVAITETHDANATVTQSVVAMAETQQAIETENAVGTENAVATQSANQTATAEAEVASAWNFSGTQNADWTVVIRQFDNHEMVLVPVNPSDSNSNPFWIDRYEVSIGQYSNFVPIPDELSGEDDNFPMRYISQDAAQSYCKSIHGDLPTDAQWEYAARGVESWVYPWTAATSVSEDELNTHVRYSGNSLNDSGRSPVSVKDFAQGASWVGAFNMNGNVAELVLSGNEYIARGGSFMDIANAIKNTSVTREPFNSSEVGFRCIRPISE